MNLDVIIHRIAVREAGSFGETLLLVAKRRADLERYVLKRANEGPVSHQLVATVIADMQRISDETVRARQPERVDRLA